MGIYLDYTYMPLKFTGVAEKSQIFLDIHIKKKMT
jgi:hypothetical protein